MGCTEKRRAAFAIVSIAVAGIEGATAKVEASVTKPAPVIPDAPFDVSIATVKMVSSCPSVSGVASWRCVRPILGSASQRSAFSVKRAWSCRIAGSRRSCTAMAAAAVDRQL